MSDGNVLLGFEWKQELGLLIGSREKFGCGTLTSERLQFFFSRGFLGWPSALTPRPPTRGAGGLGSSMLAVAFDSVAPVPPVVSWLTVPWSFSISFNCWRLRRCFSFLHQIFRRRSGTFERSCLTGRLFSSSRKRLNSSVVGLRLPLYHSLIIGSSYIGWNVIRECGEALPNPHLGSSTVNRKINEWSAPQIYSSASNY